MTQTANCARHLGVIVGKMLPHPLPQIYPPVAKRSNSAATSNFLSNHFIQRSYLKNLDKKSALYKIKLTWIIFFVFVFTESFEMTRATDMLSANWTCHISVMVSVAFLHVTMSLFFKPINGAQHEIKKEEVCINTSVSYPTLFCKYYICLQVFEFINEYI